MASGDRHGRNDRDGKDRRKAPSKVEEQDQEEEVEAVEHESDQTRDAAQDALGNQGVAAMLGMPSVTPGSAGMSVEPAERDQEEDGVQYGGDDDVPADGPLTVDDLLRSWNPGTKRGQDATAPVVLEPISDLPDEDRALMAAIRQDPRRPGLPAHGGADALLQLSVVAVTTDPGPCAREAARWGTGSLVHRTWARLLAPPAPALQDPHGRLVHSRIRVAALASLLVLDGPAPQDPGGAAVPGFCLELAGRWSLPDRVLAAVRAADNRLPVAADVLAGLLAGRRDAEVRPSPMSAAASAHLRATLGELVRPSDPSALLSGGVEVAAEEDDDPLGLDAIVASMTGGAQDPSAGLWDGFLQTAERMAGLCARLRVDAAATLLAVADVCDLWSAGAPTLDLLRIAGQVDAEVGRVLQLLVEVARAIQKRTVPPPGIRNGLRRAAKTIEAVYHQLPAWIDPVVGGVLPPGARVPPLPPPAPQDALEEAWADGEPLAAVGALRSLPASLERDVAIAWTRAAGGRPAGLADELLALARRAEERPALAAALAISAGPCLLWDGEHDRALALARAHADEAIARRNGSWLAAAGLLEVEARLVAGDPEGATAALRDTAWRCWHLGAPAALTLLLRWRPPE